MIPFLRTAAITGLLGGLVLLGYFKLQADGHARDVARLEALQSRMEAQLEAREAMLQRLSRTRRLAHVQITGQRNNVDEKILETDVLFIELDDDGSEIARQTFVIPGDVLFIDTWTVKFGHEEVATGHPLLGKTLVLLRRVYSEQMAPRDGLAIDTPGAVPPAYAAGSVGRFEKRVWEQFWRIATDAALAEEMNVRVAQGEVVYKAVRTGQSFELMVDAAGGVSLTPLAPEIAGEAVSLIDG